MPLNLIRTHQPYIDTEPVSAAPIAPGETREFRLIFDHVAEGLEPVLPGDPRDRGEIQVERLGWWLTNSGRAPVPETPFLKRFTLAHVKPLFLTTETQLLLCP